MVFVVRFGGKSDQHLDEKRGTPCVRVTLLVAGAAVVSMMAVSLVATVSGALALLAMTVVCASYPRNQLYNRGLAFSAFWVSETSPFA